MSTQKQFQSRSLETVERKPLQRTQEFLKELKITVGLVQELFQDVKFEKLELYFYRTAMLTVTLVHLIEFLWDTIWH